MSLDMPLLSKMEDFNAAHPCSPLERNAVFVAVFAITGLLLFVAWSL